MSTKDFRIGNGFIVGNDKFAVDVTTDVATFAAGFDVNIGVDRVLKQTDNVSELVNDLSFIALTDLSGAAGVNYDSGTGVIQLDSAADVTFNSITGNGAGLTNVNAATLDSIDSTSFLRSDANDQYLQTLTFTNVGEVFVVGGTAALNGADAWFRMGNGDLDWNIRYVGSTGGTDGNELAFLSTNTGNGLKIDHLGNIEGVGTHNFIGNGAGLTNVDATSLDTINSASFMRSNVDDIAEGQITFNQPLLFTNLEKTNLAVDGELGYDASQGLIVRRGAVSTTVLDGTNITAGSNITITNLGAGGTGSETFTFSVTQGAGSGLDADTLDSLNSTSFVRSDQNDTLTGNYTLNGTLDVTTDISVPTIRNATPISFLNGGSALPINTNELLVSSSYGNRSLVPTNGMYVAGQIVGGAGIDITGNATISGTLGVYGNFLNFITGTDARIEVTDANPTQGDYAAGSEFIFWGDGASASAKLTANLIQTQNVATYQVQYENAARTEGCRVEYDENSKSLEYNFF